MSNQSDSGTPAQNTNTQSQTAQANERQRQAQQTHTAQRSQQTTAPPAPAGREPVNLAPKPRENQRLAFKMGQATITQGRAGEKNLSYRWIDVPCGEYDSARFEVKSSSGGAIDVEVQQELYKKTYSGTGVVSTQPVPSAPMGTKGKMTARDAATGEMLEVPFFWYDRGRASFSLWQLIKRLIWKGDS